MTDFDDMMAWVREQIAAKVERAHKAIEYGSGGDGPWKVRGDHVDGAAAGIGFGFLPADVAFIVDNQPLAVLAQCEAHTAILDAYSDAIKRRVAEGRNYGRWVDGEPERRYPEKIMSGPDDRAIPGLELAVKLIARAYRHRPGYSEEWRP